MSEAALADPPTRPALESGTAVEVRDRFEGRWSGGFEVDRLDGDRYVIRRLSDASLLPVTFSRDDVRRERTRQTWWT